MSLVLLCFGWQFPSISGELRLWHVKGPDLINYLLGSWVILGAHIITCKIPIDGISYGNHQQTNFLCLVDPQEFANLVDLAVSHHGPMNKL